MNAKIVKVTSKGQISLPVEIRKSIGLSKGDDILMISHEGSVLIKKVDRDEFRDLLTHSQKSLSKLWDNKDDEVWDKV